ncbi:MAG: hypothetical protein Q7S23_02845 [bacterium]|nr:hypothetical protein [bacterium]
MTMNWLEHATIWSFIVFIISLPTMAVMAMCGPHICLKITFLVFLIAASLTVAGLVLRDRFGSKTLAD